ncbi:MAG TPA: class I SAM-dependent methyltransferase [Chryseosolibacter sp.]
MLSNDQAVHDAFSKQSFHFDEEDASNPVLLRMRQQVYTHVSQYLKPRSKILELNAGTGIDAVHFVKQGHTVHATDVATGMIHQIHRKVANHHLHSSLTCQQLSYTDLADVEGSEFDFIFSNFGGLNCVDDLKKVTKHFAALLRDGGYVTLVIMPVVCPWEIAGIFRHGKKALRRFRPQGVLAHLEGKYFQTYYHSLTSIRAAFDQRFTFIRSEGLAAVSAQPHNGKFPLTHPFLDKTLNQLDARVRNHFPFNRWADHLIVTLRYTP